MADNSHIQWTEATWNPVVGCQIVSPGCRECYAMQMTRRLEAMGQERYSGLTQVVNGNTVWTGEVRTLPETLEVPLRWKRPRLIFVNSMSDLFHEDVPSEFIDRVFAVMALCPQHVFQVLTKRAERMEGYFQPYRWLSVRTAADEIGGTGINDRDNYQWPLPNVWLGVSVEDQKRADERIPHLLRTPAAVRFLSCEPLLGELDVKRWLVSKICPHCNRPAERDQHSVADLCYGCGKSFFRRGWAKVERLHWCIVGGESGSGARPCNVSWIRSLRDQCKATGVPCFIKQLGKWIVGDDAGFSVARWLLDDGRVFVPPVLISRGHRPENAMAFSTGDPKGGHPRYWPEDLRVRELPR